MRTKQVIVVRVDLNMRKGKMIAQGAHASMKVFFDRLKALADSHVGWTPKNQAEREWVTGLFTKIAVKAHSEEELLAIYDRAKTAGLLCSLIQDAGQTEFHGVPTYTAVAVGPDEAEKVDAITKDLELL